MGNENTIAEAIDIINKLRQIAESADPTSIPIALQLDIDIFISRNS